jgi:hypothetical protein
VGPRHADAAHGACLPPSHRHIWRMGRRTGSAQHAVDPPGDGGVPRGPVELRTRDEVREGGWCATSTWTRCCHSSTARYGGGSFGRDQKARPTLESTSLRGIGIAASTRQSSASSMSGRASWARKALTRSSCESSDRSAAARRAAGSDAPKRSLPRLRPRMPPRASPIRSEHPQPRKSPGRWFRGRTARDRPPTVRPSSRRFR